MTVQQAYTDWSATYDSDRNLTRDLDERVTRQALSKVRCQSVLELGCGTGKNTGLFAEIGAQVHALDFSPGMIEKARARVSAPHVRFQLADLTQAWPAADHSFDLVASNLVLEHIQNLDFPFAEARRVLIDGGKFFICELHPFRQYQGIVARFQRADDSTVRIAAFTHHITDFINAALKNGFRLEELNEWWHEQDKDKPPRLISFRFEKRDNSVA